MATTAAPCCAEHEQETFDQLAKEVERVWRRSRPRLMRQLDKANQSRDRVRAAAQHCQEASDHMLEDGLPYDQANSLALYEWVYLPDIEDEG